MSKTKATTRRNKVTHSEATRPRRRRSEPTTRALKKQLAAIETCTEAQLNFIRCRIFALEERLDGKIGLVDRIDSLRSELLSCLRIHEYRGHGELVSMSMSEPSPEPSDSLKTTEPPSLRLVKGGLPDSALRKPSSNRPVLRLL